MSKKTNSYMPKPFESTIGSKKDTSANIYMSMLKSNAFMSLTSSQKVLYLYCKSQQYGMPTNERAKSELIDKLEDFTVSEYKWKETFKLYSKANRSKFYKDMNKLIEVGLIDCVRPGQSSRTKNIYKFSSRWLKYGTEDFEIPESAKSAAYKHQEAKDKKHNK